MTSIARERFSRIVHIMMNSSQVELQNVPQRAYGIHSNTHFTAIFCSVEQTKNLGREWWKSQNFKNIAETLKDDLTGE